MAHKYFYQRILQRNGKMTIEWSFSYNFFVKLVLLWSFPYNSLNGHFLIILCKIGLIMVFFLLFIK